MDINIEDNDNDDDMLHQLHTYQHPFIYRHTIVTACAFWTTVDRFSLPYHEKHRNCQFYWLLKKQQ